MAAARVPLGIGEPGDQPPRVAGDAFVQQTVAAVDAQPQRVPLRALRRAQPLRDAVPDVLDIVVDHRVERVAHRPEGQQEEAGATPEPARAAADG